jgi:lipid-A-disaccharide synthase
VDSPDFNLALEKSVRQAGVPTIHYVSPSIWAWRGWRVERIRQAANRVLLVFPFEQSIYDREGIPATYVGHPLASAIAMRPDRAAARARLGVAPDKPVICLMPGSRRAEIQYIGPVFFAAAQRIADALSEASFIVPVADVGLRPLVEQIQSQTCKQAALDRITLFDGRSHDCLEACDGALVASGTATLEAALFKRPMVIAYRVPVASAWIMRRIGGYLPWVGLPNILAGETLVPELLQEEATPQAVAEQLLRVLGDEKQQRQLEERFCAMHESLRRDTPTLASEAILHTINQLRTRPS